MGWNGRNVGLKRLIVASFVRYNLYYVRKMPGLLYGTGVSNFLYWANWTPRGNSEAFWIEALAARTAIASCLPRLLKILFLVKVSYHPFVLVAKRGWILLKLWLMTAVAGHSLCLSHLCLKSLEDIELFLHPGSNFPFSVATVRCQRKCIKNQKRLHQSRTFFWLLWSNQQLFERFHVDQQKVPGHHSAIVVLAKWRHNCGSSDRDAEFVVDGPKIGKSKPCRTDINWHQSTIWLVMSNKHSTIPRWKLSSVFRSQFVIQSFGSPTLILCHTGLTHELKIGFSFVPPVDIQRDCSAWHGALWFTTIVAWIRDLWQCGQCLAWERNM